MLILFLLSRRISFTTHAPERARLSAEPQQLYADAKFAEILAQADACLPKDMAGNFHRRTRKIRRSARPAGLPGGTDAGDEETKTAGDQRLPGLAGRLRGGQGGRHDAQDEAAELLLARLRWLPGSPEEEQKVAGRRSGSPGAGRCAAG